MYHDDLSLVLAAIGPDRDRVVGSGFLKVFGALLNWPEWMVDGTSIKPSADFPAKISLAYDLTMFANIADHAGPDYILSTLVAHPFHTSSPEMNSFLLSAPTLQHAMQFAADVLQCQYRILRFSISKPSADLIELKPLQSFPGKFWQLYSFTHLVFFAGLATYLVVDHNSIPTIELHGGDLEWHDPLQQMTATIAFVVSDELKLAMPSAWADRPNPYHDQAIWRRALDRLHTIRTAYDQADLIRQIDVEVEHMLSAEQRTPTLREVSQQMRLSQRTLNRRLSIACSTFRQRVDAVRRKRAEAMLRDSDRPITSIARCLGFSHSSSFARAFAAWTGYSPRKWRERQIGRQTD